MVRLVFLHGIGEGGITGDWHEALDAGLVRVGYPALEPDQVIAPRYAGLLKERPSPKAPMPDSTVTGMADAEADRARWEYERRQASLEELLALERRGGDVLEAPNALQSIALEITAEARRYVREAGLRACILRRVLDQLPHRGEVVIVGHSLGSLVAIDLLDCAPPNLTIRRLVTIGSPAGHVVMHVDGKRLLKEFPFSRVRSWVNVWSMKDPVPAGRGIGHLFPQALDVRIDLGLLSHNADKYLLHPVVSTAIGEGLFGPLTREVVPFPTAIERPLEQEEAVIVAGLAYGHCVTDELGKETRKQARFRAALLDVQRRVIDGIAKLYATQHRALPGRLAISEGRCPERGALFSVTQSVPALLAIASNNVIAPYEIEISKDRRKHALERLAAFLEYPQRRGTEVFEALMEARRTVNPKSAWPRILLAVVGGLLLLAGPVGLAIAVPAGLGGGAAIVAALAALVPGGMVGGLLTAGALASTGAGATVAALVGPSTPTEAFEAVVVQQLATAIARARLGDARDDGPWFALSNLEIETTREIQRLEPYSDKNSPTLTALGHKAEAVARGMKYMIEHGLGPSITLS